MNYEGHDIYSRSFNVKAGQQVTIFRFVVQDGQGGVKQAAAADADKVIGIAMEDFSPTARPGPNWMPNRQGIRVRIIGSALVEAAGPINYGDQITVDADGKATVAGGTTGVVGEAFTKAAAAGELVLVFLKVLG